ncbi:MAG: hypothetical protein JXB45_03020 [Candidatus Krumholzibacteriota bacterium]|nr:hypothetical protein [Candidatus Krumholzibacteriota bacterium]
MPSRYRRTIRSILIPLSLFLGVALPVRAGLTGEGTGRIRSLPAEVRTLSIPHEREETYPSVFGEEIFDLERFKHQETLKLTGRRISSANPPVSSRGRSFPAPPAAGMSSGGKKRVAISVLASAVLPGLGEIYLYSHSHRFSVLARGCAFMAMEGYSWYKYKTNYDKGKDYKSRYQRFCDAHWSEERFLLQHPFCDGIGGCTDWQQYNREAYVTGTWFFLYIPKYLDEEEYYENCGKYDAFAFGWDDWDGDYDNFEPWSPNRSYYWELRGESDKFLVRADQYLMFTLINRVVSMIDAGYLAYRMNKGEVDNQGWGLDIESGTQTASIGISYHF